MRRILVAVDGSRASLEAARTAQVFAEGLRARVTFLHVLPERMEEEAGAVSEFAAFEHACEEYAAHLIEEIRSIAGAPHLCADSRVLHGEPVAAISQAASAEDVDMVIVGTRDRSALARTVLGSVASALVSQCPKPVMVVPERALTASVPPPAPRPRLDPAGTR